MKRILLSLLLLGMPVVAWAQGQTTPPPTGQFWYDNTASPPIWRPNSSAYPAPSAATVTVGGFQPNGNFATLTATASSSASTALPAVSTSVRITNASSTATVSCTMATGAATGLVSNIVIPPLSSVSRVVGAFDHIACIDQTGSTGSNLVVLEGGSGLGNDSGGGGGGLSVAFGGAIGTSGMPNGFQDNSGNFQPFLGDVVSGQWVNIKASVLPPGAASSALQTTGNTALGTINTTLGSPMQNSGGTVAVTQTTSPWVTKDSNSDALLAAAQATTLPYVLYAAASTNATTIKNAAGFVYDVQLGGIGTVPAYVRFYDTASSPTCSSATGLVKSLIIPAAATAANGAGSNVTIPVGVTFVNGISMCVTGAFGATDTTNVASGSYIINVDYR